METEQVFLLLVFAVAILATLKEPAVRVGRRRIALDYGLAPPLAVALLAAAGYITPAVLRDALLGINGLVPWEVLVIFFGGAYICMCIDQTGVLDYVSSRIIRMSGGDGPRLYGGLVALTAVLTVFTSNDIITLTMTPLICYMARYARINPIPYLIAVFFTSNTWSMIFYIGNPPNIIVAQAFRLGFLEYARLMALPSVVSGVATAGLVYLVFRQEIRQRIALRADLGLASLPRPIAAIANVVAFGLFFALLALSEHIGLTVWKTVTLFSVIFLGLNLVFSFGPTLPRTKAAGSAKHTFAITHFLEPLRRVPWKMLPLILSFFIIIQLFTVHGLTDLLARGLSRLGGLWSGTLLTGYLSAISSNLMINQPATILFANAMQNAQFTLTGTERLASGLALIVGTNLGGNITLFGALAGLMWSKILAHYGVEMSYGRFLRISIRVMPLAILVTLLTIALQMQLLWD